MLAFSSISHIYTFVFLLGQWCKSVVRSFRFCTYLKLCEFNCKCVRLSTVVLCLILSLLHSRLSAVTQYSAHSITFGGSGGIRSLSEVTRDPLRMTTRSGQSFKPKPSSRSKMTETNVADGEMVCVSPIHFLIDNHPTQY